MASVRTTYAFEIEAELAGTTTEASGDGWNEPFEPGGVEDAEIVGLSTLHFIPRGLANPYGGRHVATSLLEGVNTKSPDVQRLLENMLAAIQEEANEALLEAAADVAGDVETELAERELESQP